MTLSVPDNMLSALIRTAVALATKGLPGNQDRGAVPVLWLRGKGPAVPGGHGVLDATCDVGVLREQLRRCRPSGIGIPVQGWEVRLDIDPRNGGDVTLARLVAEHGPLPDTLTVISGRADGGRHLWWVRPPGRLTGRRLPGIDVLGSGKYTVGPPSTHPDTGGLYRWGTVAAAAVMPRWLAELVTEPEPVVRDVPRSRGLRVGRLSVPSIVEQVNASITWHTVLDPHGWRCVKGDGDQDGSTWLHPAATSRCSATVRGGRLYVWTTSTEFTPSAPGEPHGYSRAEALALLGFGGDLRALVASVRATGVVA